MRSCIGLDLGALSRLSVFCTFLSCAFLSLAAAFVAAFPPTLPRFLRGLPPGPARAFLFLLAPLTSSPSSSLTDSSPSSESSSSSSELGCASDPSPSESEASSTWISSASSTCALGSSVSAVDVARALRKVAAAYRKNSSESETVSNTTPSLRRAVASEDAPWALRRVSEQAWASPSSSLRSTPSCP